MNAREIAATLCAGAAIAVLLAVDGLRLPLPTKHDGTPIVIAFGERPAGNTEAVDQWLRERGRAQREPRANARALAVAGLATAARLWCASGARKRGRDAQRALAAKTGQPAKTRKTSAAAPGSGTGSRASASPSTSTERR